MTGGVDDDLNGSDKGSGCNEKEWAFFLLRVIYGLGWGLGWGWRVHKRKHDVYHTGIITSSILSLKRGALRYWDFFLTKRQDDACIWFDETVPTFNDNSLWSICEN